LPDGVDGRLILGVVSFMNGGCWRSNASRTPHWALVLFGAATVPLGFFLRNGLGRHYGVGRAGGHVSRRDAIVTFILLLAVIVIEVLAGSR